MEQDMVSENLDSELLELPPLKDMKEIISEFENSGLANESLMFNENEMDSGYDNVEGRATTSFDLNSTLNEDASKLHEVEDLEFEIPTHNFEDIKIKDDLTTEVIEQIKEENYLHNNVMEECAPKVECYLENNVEKYVEMKIASSSIVPHKDELLISKDNKNLDDNNSNIGNKTLVESPKKNDPTIYDKVDEEDLQKSDSAKNSTDESLVETKDIDGSSQEVLESVIPTSDESNIIDSDSNKNLDDSEKLAAGDNKLNTDTKPNRNAAISAFMNRLRNKPDAYGPFEVIVPLIGKNVFEKGNDKPFVHRYDLARERNRTRAEYQKNNPDFFIPNISPEEWRRQRESRTKEQIEKEEFINTVNAIRLALSFLRMGAKILQEYQKDEPNERRMMRYLKYFSFAPASPLSLLYAPHIVHTVMLCRGDNKRSAKLRRLANYCYEKCHCLFPIPEGYNFETVFTSEVKKNIPDYYNNLEKIVMEYGDYDSSDLEDEFEPNVEGNNDDNWE